MPSAYRFVRFPQRNIDKVRMWGYRNIEYCYCVMDSNPIVTGVISSYPESAEYRFNRKLFLGHTTLSDDEI